MDQSKWQRSALLQLRFDPCQRRAARMPCAMALFGSLAALRIQTAGRPVFTATFSYLDELFRAGSTAGERLNAIAIGETHRIELDGGAFALEQVYRSKTRPEGFFESHRKYIDVQVVFAGLEWMEIADLTQAVAREPYNGSRDLLIYQDVANASLLHVGAGYAAIFYPSDVHMPGLCGAGVPAVVRKTVVKVPVSAV